MTASESHKRLKSQAAGKSETKLKSGKRLDSASPKRATEIERSGTTQGLGKAVDRLKESRKPQKVLRVPNNDLQKAVKIAKEKRYKGLITNLGGTKRRNLKGK